MMNTSRAVSVLAAAVLISAAPVRADEYGGTSMGQETQTMQQGQKDQCLLVAMNCPDSYKADTVQQRVDRLKKEIARGTDVYTEQELNTLNEQLKWISQESGNDAGSE